jgi:homocysteine S-methyltransferase
MRGNEMHIKDYLKENRLIPDGSMGTYYSELVNKPGVVSELANLLAPDIIKQIHIEYITAGARMIRTNTFAANHVILKMSTIQQTEVIRAACRIAKKAVEEAVAGRNNQQPVWILGDVGPIPEDANTKEEDILNEYKRMCDIFLEEGLDGIHFETFPGYQYIVKLAPYIKAKNSDVFLLASFSVNKNGYTSSGISASRILDKVSEMDEIDACGLNCGIGSGHMYQLLQKINLPANKNLYAAPNAGYPEQMQNRMVFMDNEEYFAGNMRRIAELGVDIIGSCCGTTPEYTKKLKGLANRKELVSSRRKPAEISDNVAAKVKDNDLKLLLDSGKKVIAVELDPPYDADIDKVMECAHKLKNSGADIITFADSPMGRSRVDSILMSIKISGETGLKVMPHVCCRDRNMISMRSTLLGAYIHGIRNLLIVTGDPVPGENRNSTTGVFDYNSIQLMEYVKR